MGLQLYTVAVDVFCTAVFGSTACGGWGHRPAPQPGPANPPRAQRSQRTHTDRL